MDKLRAVVLIEIKVMLKYEDFMTILLSQIWGNEPRNNICKKYVFEYIKIVERIVRNGISKGEIVEVDAEVIATEIFGIICSSLVYKLKIGKPIDIKQIYSEYEKTVLKGLQK